MMAETAGPSERPGDLVTWDRQIADRGKGSTGHGAIPEKFVVALQPGYGSRYTGAELILNGSG